MKHAASRIKLTILVKGSELADDNGGMTRYSDGKLQNFVRICAVVVSSLLPILSILGLYFVPDEKLRIGLIVMFSFVCSATLASLTNAKSIEIIMATAACVFPPYCVPWEDGKKNCADIMPDTRRYRSSLSVGRRLRQAEFNAPQSVMKHPITGSPQ